MNYSEEILDHAKNPRNFGDIKGKTHEARETNATCGDMVEFYLKIKNGVVERAGFRGLGCALSTAMASMLTEKVKGMRIEEVEKINDGVVKELMGEVNPGRIKCVTLPVLALRKALEENE